MIDYLDRDTQSRPDRRDTLGSGCKAWRKCLLNGTESGLRDILERNISVQYLEEGKLNANNEPLRSGQFCSSSPPGQSGLRSQTRSRSMQLLPEVVEPEGQVYWPGAQVEVQPRSSRPSGQSGKPEQTRSRSRHTPPGGLEGSQANWTLRSHAEKEKNEMPC